MKHIFAKIIELPDHQVLVTKGLDDDGDYTLNVTTRFPGVDPSIKVGYATDEAATEAFNDFNEDGAKAFIDHITEIMGGQ